MWKWSITFIRLCVDYQFVYDKVENYAKHNFKDSFCEKLFKDTNIHGFAYVANRNLFPFER